MTHDEFDQRWTTALGVAKMTLIRDGLLHHTFLVVGRDGRGGPVAADFASARAREDSYALLRLACVAADAVFVAYLGEAEAAAGDVLTPGGCAAVPEARLDVLVVSAAARAGDEGRVTFRASLREILRDTDGRATGLRPLALPRSGDADEDEPNGTADAYAGPLADVLPRERPTPAERRRAREALEHATKRRARGQPPFPR